MANEQTNQGGQQTTTTQTTQSSGQTQTQPATPVRIDTSSDVYFFKGGESTPLTTKESK